MKKHRGIVWCPHCSQPHRLDDRVCPETGKALARGLHRESEHRHPLIGTVLDGRYRIDSVLGYGGAGIVFAGTNMALGRDVAIKLVKTARDEDSVERLRREASIIAAIQHPNICDIHHFGVVPLHGPYVVTERLVGETIAERLKWNRWLAAPNVIEVLVQILSALQAAHAANIVHRDVKPENVFLTERVGCPPLVKLLDFGLAKSLGNLEGSRQLTRPGKTMGTPLYMTPEQLMGEPVTPATDLFAVGLLAYLMLVGRHPFAANTILDVQARVLRRAPMPMSSLYREVSPQLEAVIMKALEKNPHHRHPDAHAMQRALLTARASCEDDRGEPSSSYTPTTSK